MLDNQSYAIMRNHPERLIVPNTERLRANLFVTKKPGSELPEVIYQGTGLVASLLECMDQANERPGPDREIAFVDRGGTLFDNAHLRELQVFENGGTTHIAHFEVDGRPMKIFADDIYCLGMAALSTEIEPLREEQEPQIDTLALAA